MLEKSKGGRPIGSVSWKTRVAQQFARNILLSDEYRKSLEERIRNRTLPPQIEQLLWHYSWGKPQENVSLTISHADEDDDLSLLSAGELVERAERALASLKEAQAIEDAIPAEFKGHVEDEDT